MTNEHKNLCRCQCHLWKCKPVSNKSKPSTPNSVLFGCNSIRYRLTVFFISRWPPPTKTLLRYLMLSYEIFWNIKCTKCACFLCLCVTTLMDEFIFFCWIKREWLLKCHIPCDVNDLNIAETFLSPGMR